MGIKPDPRRSGRGMAAAEEMGTGVKSEIRNSKSETNPKFKTEEMFKARQPVKFRTFGFRIWNLFRISNFGFRISLLGALLLPLGVSAQALDDNQATFFMGRVKYSSNDGNDCGGVGQDLMKLVSRTSTLKIQEERKVRLTDPDLFETPFIFMNGHNDFVLVEAELSNLRKYLGHGGFFFGSGCCT